MEPKIDLEKLLNDGAIIRIKPQGYSMYPLFIPGRDEALIQQVPIGYLQRNDVVLYRGTIPDMNQKKCRWKKSVCMKGIRMWQTCFYPNLRTEK